MSKLSLVMAICAVAGGAAGCAYPVSSVEQGSSASALYFSPAFAAAHVWVDGADMGVASAFDGKKSVLPVTSGRHRVVVKGDGAPLFDQPVYVGPGSQVEVKAS
jgi:hypothetical protein